MPRPLYVVGRFPPPLDGQTLATQRLAELMAANHTVYRVNTSAPEAGAVAVEVRFRPARVRHYLGGARALRRVLGRAPEAPVLWASISPARLGHWRDLTATLPAFRPAQRVFAVLHRGTFERLFQSPLTAPTARYLVRRLAGFVFLNRAFSEACAPWIPAAKRHVIPNTIDDAVLLAPAEVAAKQSGRRERTVLRLLFLSSMIRLKGYLDVLEAVRLLTAQGVPVEVRFAGRWGGEEDRRLFEEKVAQGGLEAVVTFHGALAGREAVKALHVWADVFLLPSYHPTEAMPLALLEALNAATPAVVTNHGGLPEVVREGREALLVPPRDPAALAHAVLQLRDPARWLELSEGARRRFLSAFSPDAVRRKWETLIGL